MRLKNDVEFKSCSTFSYSIIYIVPDAAITGWTGAVTIDGASGSGNAPAVAETAAGKLFSVTATASSGTVEYEFDTDGNPDSIADELSADGVVVLASGKTLDYETATSHVFKIV